jgi:RNA polymerase sigma-70 factor (ECF subfamily)
MDDALQEAYVRAFRALPRFRGDARVGTWLFRITYNACLDELARGRKVTHVHLDELVEQASGDPQPGEELSDRSEVTSALRALPADERAVIFLVDVQGYNYARAAEIVGVPVGTVASRLNRARLSLRRALRAGARGSRSPLENPESPA